MLIFGNCRKCIFRDTKNHSENKTSVFKLLNVTISNFLKIVFNHSTVITLRDERIFTLLHLRYTYL